MGGVIAGLLTVAPSAMAAEESGPVNVQPCPAGWTGVQVYIQTSSGDRDYRICIQA